MDVYNPKDREDVGHNETNMGGAPALRIIPS